MYTKFPVFRENVHLVWLLEQYLGMDSTQYWVGFAGMLLHGVMMRCTVAGNWTAAFQLIPSMINMVKLWGLGKSHSRNHLMIHDF